MQISPGIAHPPSRLCLSDLRRSVPYRFRALMIGDTSPRYAASYPLPVRQASALPSASSRFTVARDTLAFQLTLPLVGRVEDLHLQVSAPCRANTKKKKRAPTAPFSTTRRQLRISRDDGDRPYRHPADRGPAARAYQAPAPRRCRGYSACPADTTDQRLRYRCYNQPSDHSRCRRD